MAKDPFTLTLVGAKQMRDALARVGPKLLPALSDLLREESLEAFQKSQRQTPHADGALRSSGVVRPPKIGKHSVTVVLGYGGAASDYALRQHEDLSLNHPDPTNPNSDPAGKAKYLEDPVRKQIPAIRANLAKRVKKAMP